MFTLIGSAIGFFSSFLPKLMDYFQDKQDKKHELHLADKQIEMQLKLGDQKLQAIAITAETEEVKALHKEQVDITKKASQWCINLSSSVRPVIAYLFFIEFFLLTIAMNFRWITMAQYNAIWDDPMQAIFACVVSYYFGSRTMNRSSHT